ncbi:MAG: serine protease [Planctomycetaceae bacterium]|nr:serine protease [Planctomycetaceae bacterium]
MSRLRTVLALLFLTICLPAAAAAQTPLINSSVKLRVDSAVGHDWGTGTIIDTRPGPEGMQALVLTCGHIFRESKGQGRIEVHLFGENSTMRVLGSCLFYDLDIDLAFVVIAPPSPVRAIPIAPASYQVQPLQSAWSVGCDHGGNPTVRTHQIMSVDRISEVKKNGMPFHYIQVSGAPVGGRSGGGLFSSEGYLIGVCLTGCPIKNDGHFVPPHMIRHVLDNLNLAHIHQNPSLGEPTRQPPPPVLAALKPLEANPAPLYAARRSEMSLEEQATLEEVNRGKQDGDEVIVIVMSSTRNPGMRSNVIVLNGPSEPFLDALVKSPPASNNSVIFSSHPPERHPVSFPVRY